MQAAPRAAEVARPVRLEARNTAVDAYRGFVMILMMAEVLSLPQVAKSFPGSSFWSFPALDGPLADVFHVRRYVDADRTRLSVIVPARIPAAALGMDCPGHNSVRL